MRDQENIAQLVELKPDYIGFILYPKSKRFLGEDYVLAADIPGSIRKVGVFVNALIRDIFRWTNPLHLDFAQLHGSEPPEYCRELQKMNIRVIKAFGIDENFDFDILNPYQPYCDYFLFDTKTSQHGGSGRKFNWQKLQEYTLEKPFFLSGGIGPEDAARFKTKNDLPIHALDINSRFEDEPGLKNISLVEQFITKIRS